MAYKYAIVSYDGDDYIATTLEHNEELKLGNVVDMYQATYVDHDIIAVIDFHNQEIELVDRSYGE